MITEIKVGLNFGSEIQSVGRLAERNGIIYNKILKKFLKTSRDSLFSTKYFFKTTSNNFMCFISHHI